MRTKSLYHKSTPDTVLNLILDDDVKMSGTSNNTKLSEFADVFLGTEIMIWSLLSDLPHLQKWVIIGLKNSSWFLALKIQNFRMWKKWHKNVKDDFRRKNSNFSWKSGFELQIKIIILARKFKFEFFFFFWIWILAPKIFVFSFFAKVKHYPAKQKMKGKWKGYPEKNGITNHIIIKKSRLRDNCSIAFKNRLVGLWFSKIRILLNFRFLHHNETKIKTMFKKLDFWKT